MDQDILLLGVDGGGTRCRARVCNLSGDVIGEGLAGPANARLGPEEAVSSVLRAVSDCFIASRLALGSKPIAACLALAGAAEPSTLAALKAHSYPFDAVVLTTDSHAACVGAHGGADGGVIICGTGSIGEALLGGRHHRVGGWGFPISDEGSGAWLGLELLRKVLWAFDGRVGWTTLLSAAFQRFDSDPHAIVRWMGSAKPRDYASLAPLVIEHANGHDDMACELLGRSARHVDLLARRLRALGANRLALTGGLAESLHPWLGAETRCWLVPPKGDALSGAIELARCAALARINA